MLNNNDTVQVTSNSVARVVPTLRNLTSNDSKVSNEIVFIYRLFSNIIVII